MTQTLVVKNLSGAEGERRFTASFTVGRSKDCEFSIKEPSISRKHVKVEFDGTHWWVEDLDSGNGTFLNGQQIRRAQLFAAGVIELGQGGPQISLALERHEEQPEISQLPSAASKIEDPILERVHLGPPPKRPSRDFSSETQIIKHFFDKSESETAGDQTMMFRRAFNRAQKSRARKYQWLIGVAVLLLVAAGSVILYQKNKLDKMRATAQNIFYMMKSQELQIVKLEDLVLLKADPQQVAELQAKREKFQGMSKEYDNFVKELGIYAKLSDEDRVIMKVARVFGECEVNMPKGFADEVKRYIAMWKSSDRLKTALAKAQDKGYAPLITKILNDNNLPPQYFFLALQESNFDERAVGPPTRYGCAKGMWQFISQTADHYGLRIGPLYDQGVYDPLDERFDYLKASVAAMKYIKELNQTNAQASGLLVLASYNWGEGNVREVIKRMPENPRERNFWRLLEMKNIPKETYDYVYLILSAAVICENPKLFGFDLTCPACSETKSAVQTALMSH